MPHRPMRRRAFSGTARRAWPAGSCKQRNPLHDMHFKYNLFASVTTVLLGAILSLGILADARAEDQKSDATGTWSWTTRGRQGGPDRKITAKLKVSGDKITGTVSSPSRDGGTTDTEITDGKVKGDEVTFSTSREV